jgi:hypothetical protein
MKSTPFDTIEVMRREKIRRNRPRPSGDDYGLPQELSDTLDQLLGPQGPRDGSKKSAPRSKATPQATLGGNDAKHP